MADSVELGLSPPVIDSAPNRPTGIVLSLQQEIFIFCVLMLVTCLFLPWQVSDTEVSPWQLFSITDSIIVKVAWINLFLLYVLALGCVGLPNFRPWVGIATALTVNVALALVALLPGQLAYGAELAKLFALGLLVLSANPAIVKAGDLAMSRLNSQKAEVFTHWGTVLPDIQFSAQEFYERLEHEVRARDWPGVEFLRVRYSEAGLLSHDREYLRVIRQRQVFDVCAANFGRDYFYTMREAEIRAQLTLATLIIFLLALVTLFSLCLSLFGAALGLASFVMAVAAGFFLLFNVLRMGLTRLDGLLMRAPVIGPVYETWFRRSTTYFQHDTRVVFLKLMDDLVKAQVDEDTSAKGVKLLSCFEHQPIFDGFYKTSTRTPQGGDAK